MSEALARAEKQRYLLLGRQTRSASNAWWQECKRAQQPFVEVISGLNRARVKLDLHTVPHDLTISSLAEIETLIAAYVAWGKSPRYHLGWLNRDSVSFPVLPYDAHEVAWQLVRIANDSIRRCESREAACLRHINSMERPR